MWPGEGGGEEEGAAGPPEYYGLESASWAWHLDGGSSCGWRNSSSVKTVSPPPHRSIWLGLLLTVFHFFLWFFISLALK